MPPDHTQPATRLRRRQYFNPLAWYGRATTPHERQLHGWWDGACGVWGYNVDHWSTVAELPKALPYSCNPSLFSGVTTLRLPDQFGLDPKP